MGVAVRSENADLASVLWRPLYLCLGLTLVLIGFIGVFVPVWPTTIFMIMAVWAFKRSSPPLESWLLNHPWFGQTLRDWDEHRAIRPQAKAISISAIWVCMALSAWVTGKVYVYVILAVVGVSLTAFIWTRKSGPASPPPDRPSR